MPGTKLLIQYDIDGNRLPDETIEISDEELEAEAEERAMAKADELIDSINTLAEARVFLKRLVKRLIRKGVLP